MLPELQISAFKVLKQSAEIPVRTSFKVDLYFAMENSPAKVVFYWGEEGRGVAHPKTKPANQPTHSEKRKRLQGNLKRVSKHITYCS